MEQIACKECASPDCHGCNMYRLERMLMSGKMDALMGENRGIKMDADVRPVVYCKDCEYYQADCGWCGLLDIGMNVNGFCPRGEKRKES